MPSSHDPQGDAVRTPVTVAGGLWSANRSGGGLLGRIWWVLAITYACVGVALHVVFGVFFGLGYGVLPWWFITLMLGAWAAVWVPVVRLLRSKPGMVAFLALGADFAILLGFGLIADAVGWM
jgi:hypothetical protein